MFLAERTPSVRGSVLYRRCSGLILIGALVAPLLLVLPGRRRDEEGRAIWLPPEWLRLAGSALVALGQGAALSWIDAGPGVHFQHLSPPRAGWETARPKTVDD